MITVLTIVLAVLLAITSSLLVVLILLHRGKGGGTVRPLWWRRNLVGRRLVGGGEESRPAHGGHRARVGCEHRGRRLNHQHLVRRGNHTSFSASGVEHQEEIHGRRQCDSRQPCRGRPGWVKPSEEKQPRESTCLSGARTGTSRVRASPPMPKFRRNGTALAAVCPPDRIRRILRRHRRTSRTRPIWLT